MELSNFNKEKSADTHRAYKSLIRHLGLRDYSEKELREKLSQKYTDDVVEFTVQQARNNGWLASPQKLATRTAQLLQRKGKGFLYIENYLMEKGLPSVTRNDDLELTTARLAIEKKFGDLKNWNFEKTGKITRFLQGRGFESSIISKVLSLLTQGNN